MSLGSYNVTGEVIYVETPQNKNSYIISGSYPDRYLATKDVLINKVDPVINFATYDNWTTTSDYTHINQPDSVVDMIVMIWRGLVFANWWSGEASLGYGNLYNVENGTIKIKAGYGNNAGSGVTVHYWVERPLEYTSHSTVHEIGHWLLGSAHPYGGPNDHGFWGIMRHSNDGICANTQERERLGWITPTLITSDALNVTISDYITTGAAFKFHPSNGYTNEYFYFENHQKLSVYDYATRNDNDKGIFVLHQQDIYNGSNNIRCKTSKWSMELDIK